MSDAAIATSSSKPAATAVASAVVQRVEQRLSPRKHYAYVIQMSWNNDEDTYALRSHLELFHFQCRLLDYYPDAAGLGDYARIIPRLPGKHAHAKTADKALKYVQEVQIYLQQLFNLPPEVSRSDMVLMFFRPTRADRNFADLERTLASHADKMSTTGLKVDELREHHNQRLSQLVEQEKQQTQAVAVAIAKRSSATSDRRDTGDLLSMLVKNMLHRAFFRVELSFEQGERLDVIRMTSCPGGHWYCRRQQDEQEEGYVPIDHVEIDAGAVMAVLTRAYSRKPSQDEETTPESSAIAATVAATATDAAPTVGEVVFDNDNVNDNDETGESDTVGAGAMVVAIFDYVGEEGKELTFEAGTVLRVEKPEPGGWLLATVIRLPGVGDGDDGGDDGLRRPSVRHQRGWLPGGYVQLLAEYKLGEEDE